MEHRDTDRLPVRFGMGTLETTMNKTEAFAWGEMHMDASLRNVGFVCRVAVSDPSISGSLFYKVSYELPK